MSTLTKEQVLKFAAAWQAMIVLVTWYVNTIGIDSLNRLLFGVALLVALVIMFLWKDDTEKVAVAIGTVDRFLKSQLETEKAKEASEKLTTISPELQSIMDFLISITKEKPEVKINGKEDNKEEDGPKTEKAW